MSELAPSAGRPMLDTLARTRKQRIQTFLAILTILNIPIFCLGILDLLQASGSWLTLMLSVCAFVYYGLYYLLLRAGYGAPATYGCVMLLSVLIALGIHHSGGFLMAHNALYFLLVVGVGLVLDDPRAIDVTVALCLISYGGVTLYELGVSPPTVFSDLYANPNSLAVVAITITMLISLVGSWVVMRNNLLDLWRSTSVLEAARGEAEARARENAILAAQVQSSNESLLATQSQLRDTVEALALPLIPLDERVALLPLVGYLDNARADRLVSGLLEGIHQRGVRAVVLDITGLRAVDERAASALLQAVQAARLLGAHVVVSGVSAEAAQALVNIGTDMSGLQTAGSLNDALRILGADRRRIADN